MSDFSTLYHCDRDLVGWDEDAPCWMPGCDRQEQGPLRWRDSFPPVGGLSWR